MARIAGVDIPRNKKVAYSLKNVNNSSGNPHTESLAKGRKARENGQVPEDAAPIVTHADLARMPPTPPGARLLTLKVNPLSSE